jgi:hypothetical protein
MVSPRGTLGLALLLWLLPPCAACFAEESAPPSGEGKFSLASLGIKSEAIFKSFGYFEGAPADDRLYFEEGIFRLEWAREFAPWVNVKLVGELRGDTDGDASGINLEIPDTDRHRSVLSLREATVNLRRAPIEFAFGKQFFAWGTADAYNPTDGINPYDYMDVLDNEKLAVLSAGLRVQLGATSLVAVVVPFFTPSRLPLPDSRWAPSPPAGLMAVLDDREVPGRDAANVQYAARLRTTLGGWDLSASYYHGFQAVPEFRASTVQAASGGTATHLTPVFPRINAVGMDFSTTFGGIEVHGEGVVQLVEDNGREDSFRGIAGFSYTWDRLGHPWLDAVTLVLEYARQVALRTRDASILPSGGGDSEIGDLLAFNAFQNTLAGRAQFKVNEDTQVKLTGNLNFDGPFSYYTQVALTHQFTGSFQAEVGLDVLGGQARSFWGRWGSNDRAFLVLRYLF